MTRPLRIFLCDLTHDSILLASDTIPINIGFIAAFAKKVHGASVEISLFKYPNAVIQALNDSPPDVIALSNYSWNSNLSEHVAKLAKRANPGILTVQGGPNFPERDDLQLQFLLSRPNTDVFIEFEAEVAFAALIGCAIAARQEGPPADQAGSPGCVSIASGTRHRKPVLLKGAKPARLKDLDQIPSPYLSGMMDQFFDGRLVPFLETNRGCPFACTFCHTGNLYFNKINYFSIDRIRDEIRYIGDRLADSGITHLYLADTNFGMYPRDKEVCEALVSAQDRYGWPLHMYATTGKNNKERVMEITKVLGQSLSVHMSVQSMDPLVLENIKRSNIRLDDYVQVNKALVARGQITRGELIVGLPGETRQSFTKGIEQLLDANVSIVTSYSLILLHGTPFKDPAYANQYEIVSKYRLVPFNFGEYAGERIFDGEETGVATKDMSFDDYLWMRGLSLFVEILHNSRPFDELFRYAALYGAKPFDVILKAYGSVEHAPLAVREIVEAFMEETRNELWDSEEALVQHYLDDDNFARLLDGSVGGNVINKYKGASVVGALDGWVDFLCELCSEIAGGETVEELRYLGDFVRYKLHGLLDLSRNSEIAILDSPYDIIAWLNDGSRRPLSEYERLNPIRYKFEYSPKQRAVQKDMLGRYGSDWNGISKIMTRVSGIETLFRHCQVDERPTSHAVADVGFEGKPGPPRAML